jgi:hypothetical protein
LKYLVDLFAAKVEDVEPAIPNGETGRITNQIVIEPRQANL